MQRNACRMQCCHWRRDPLPHAFPDFLHRKRSSFTIVKNELRITIYDFFFFLLYDRIGDTLLHDRLRVRTVPTPSRSPMHHAPNAYCIGTAMSNAYDLTCYDDFVVCTRGSLEFKLMLYCVLTNKHTLLPLDHSD